MPMPKPIARDAVPAALEKAQQYRLLNEPLEAESICRDILLVDPNHRLALTTLLLALTDQFDMHLGVNLEACKPWLAMLSDEYEHEYYSGIMFERWGKSLLSKGLPHQAVPWIHEAMLCFDRAASLCDEDKPDAILRWNTCARILDRHGLSFDIDSSLTRDVEGDYSDEVPTR